MGGTADFLAAGMLSRFLLLVLLLLFLVMAWLVVLLLLLLFRCMAFFISRMVMGCVMNRITALRGRRAERGRGGSTTTAGATGTTAGRSNSFTRSARLNLDGSNSSSLNPIYIYYHIIISVRNDDSTN